VRSVSRKHDEIGMYVALSSRQSSRKQGAEGSGAREDPSPQSHRLLSLEPNRNGKMGREDVVMEEVSDDETEYGEFKRLVRHHPLPLNVALPSLLLGVVRARQH
jgi:hypothetical protein